jgi:hypothetical protein
MIMGGDPDYSRWGSQLCLTTKAKAAEFMWAFKKAFVPYPAKGIPGFPVTSLPWLTHQLGYLPAPWLED